MSLIGFTMCWGGVRDSGLASAHTRSSQTVQNHSCCQRLACGGLSLRFRVSIRWGRNGTRTDLGQQETTEERQEEEQPCLGPGEIEAG